MSAQPTVREAFDLALLPGLAGSLFHGMGLVNDVIPEVPASGGGALVQALGLHGGALKARAGVTARTILAIEELEQRLGVEVVPRPESAAEHAAWALATEGRARALVAGDPAGRAAYAAGAALAQTLADVELELIALALEAAAPGLPPVAARIEEIGRHRAPLRAAWIALTGEAALPADARAAARRVRELLDTLPAAGRGEPSARADALSALANERAAIEAALG